MRKSIALLLVMMMFVTMVSPMHAFGSEYSRINLYYILDPAVLSEPSVDVYSTFMRVSTYQPNGANGSMSGMATDFLSYGHESVNVGEPVNFSAFAEVFSTGLSYVGNHTVDTTQGGDRIIMIGFDPDLGDGTFTFSETPVTIDVPFMHEDPSFMLSYAFEGGKTLYSSRAFLPGNYQMYYTRTESLDGYSTLKVLTENVSIDGTETGYIGTITSGNMSYTTEVLHGELAVTGDNLRYNNSTLVNVHAADVIETNLGGLERNLRLEGNGNVFDVIVNMLELNLPIDMTTVNAAQTLNDEYRFGAHINELFSFTDANGHPIRFNQIEGGFVSVESASSLLSGPMNNSYIDLNSHSGQTTITIEIPDLGLVATRTINVLSGSNPPPVTTPAYKDFEVAVIDPETSLPLVGTYVATEMNRNEIHIYVPENSTANLSIRGIYEDETSTAPLPIAFDSSNHPQYVHDPSLGTISLGTVQGGYRDVWRGTVEGTNVVVSVYKGVLGKIKLENVDSTPENPKYYSGEVEFNVSYKLTNGSEHGSNSNGWVHNGDFLIPLQDTTLGVSYAYTIISPSEGNSSVPQANTPFVDLTDKMGNVQNGFIDLGAAKFQIPTFTANVLDKNGEAPEFVLAFANGIYQGSEFDIVAVRVVLGTWYDETSQKHNRIYLAPFNQDFSDVYEFHIEAMWDGMKPIDEAVDITIGSKTFQEQADQIFITMQNPKGEPLEEGPGLDRHIYASEEGEFGASQVYLGNTSTAYIAGFEEGKTYTLQLHPDQGDFDHLFYYDGRRVTFTYTSIPGEYTGVDSAGESVPFIVDSEGMMHLTLSMQMAQIYGTVYTGGQPYTKFTTVHAYDLETDEFIGSGTVHTAGGYNGEDLQYGIFLIGSDEPLSGNYKLIVDDPQDTVEYTGTSVNVTLPITEGIRIDLPTSKVFGNIILSPEDTTQFENNITRVYVNLFDATGKYLKNVLVRRDGKFSAGELENGKYFAKVFVSPFSPLASKYTSSKMNIFTVDNALEGSINFNAPLIRVIGETSVIRPDSFASNETWVRIYNSNGAEVEAIKSNDMGVVKIPQLPNGEYVIKAFGKDGFEDSLPQTISIVDGALASAVDALYLTTPQVSGDVKDNQGNLIQNVTVLIFDENMNLVSSEISNTGSFTFGGLSNGNYFIQARTEGNQFVASDRLAVSYEGSPIYETITLQDAYYSGVVRKPSGEVLENGWVHLYENGSYYKSVMIASDGTFVLEALDLANTYEAFAEDSTGELMPSESLTLTEAPSIGLAVRADVGLKTTLYYGADILSGTKYLVYDAQGEALYQGQTNAFGELTLVDVPVGVYTIIVPMGTDFLSTTIDFMMDGQIIPATLLINGR